MAAESAEIRAARRRLQGLRVFLHVVYALLFFEMLRYLPQAEDMAWAESRLGLIQLLIDNRVELLRIVIGGGLALIYWNTATTPAKSMNAIARFRGNFNWLDRTTRGPASRVRRRTGYTACVATIRPSA